MTGTADGLFPGPRRRGAVSPGVPERYAAVVAGYRAALEQAGTSAHTRRAYASRVTGFLRWLTDTEISVDPLTDGRARDLAVRGYRSWLLAVAKKAPNTVNAHLTAVDDFYIHLGLGPVRADRVDLPWQAPRALNTDEQHRLLRAASRLPSVRDKTIVRLLYHSGIRVAELVALDVDDVPTTARTGTIVIRAGEGRDGGEPRTIPANTGLRRALIEYQQARHDLPGAGTCSALLLNRYGQRLSARAVEKMLTALGASIGLNGLVPYVLRHTFATDMLRAGADIALIAELLGHASLSTTRTYTHSSEADRARAVELLHRDQ